MNEWVLKAVKNGFDLFYNKKLMLKSVTMEQVLLFIREMENPGD